MAEVGGLTVLVNSRPKALGPGTIRQLDLPQSEKADLIAFLETLSDKPRSVSVPELPR